MDRAREIARKLSPTMRRALLADGPSRSSYSLCATVRTMEALAARKLVRRVAGVGAFYSPQTAIEWPLTDLGHAARNILKDQDNGE